MNISREDVERYLSDVKEAIRKGNYTVSARDKNNQLFLDYIINEQKRTEILLDLTVEDFSEVVNNEHPNFAHELLYIFGKDIKLTPRFGGAERSVSLYIKFNKLKNMNVIVISFHEQEHPLNYAFR